MGLKRKFIASFAVKKLSENVFILLSSKFMRFNHIRVANSYRSLLIGRCDVVNMLPTILGQGPTIVVILNYYFGSFEK